MINKTKITYTTESLSDGSYILSIEKEEMKVIKITLLDASKPEHKEIWIIRNQDNELGNFLYLVKQYIDET